MGLIKTSHPPNELKLLGSKFDGSKTVLFY